MNALTELVGWSLIHFLWQGTAIASATAAALHLLRRRSSSVRYLASCAGLILMLAAPFVTAAWLEKGVSLETANASLPPGETLERGVGTGVAHRTASEDSASADDHHARPLFRAWLIPAIVFVWLGGVAILLSRLAAGWWYLNALGRSALRQPPSRWQSACAAMAGRLRLGAVPHVIDSVRVDVPTLIGWLRPVVLLPVAALANLTPAQVDSILAHELAHIRRHDYLVNLLQTLAETLLFYHPGVWWISARVRTEREHCCDEIAVAVGGDPRHYARALVELESWRVTAAPMAIAATGGSLFDRVRRIVGAPADEPPRAAGWGVALALIVLCTAGAGAVNLLQPAHRVGSEPAAALQSGESSQVAHRIHRLLQDGISQLVRDSLRWMMGGTVLEPPTPPTPPTRPTPPTLATPPIPPTPPTPPTPPSRDWAGGDDGEFRMRWSNLLTSMDVSGRGDITFNESLTDIERLSPGGYLKLREWNTFVAYTVEVHEENGTLVHKYYVGGFPRPYDDQARQRLASALPTLVRRSGLGARTRTRQILAARGIPGLLEEIRRLDGDYVRRVYFTELMKNTRLDAPAVARTLTLAADLIASDYELAETLRTYARSAAVDQTAAKAYVDATRRIDSDYEQRRALEALLRADGVVPSAGQLALQASLNIQSDYERAELIRAALRTPIDRLDPLFAAVSRMDSDFEKRRALSGVVDNRNITLEAKNGLLAAATHIHSDFERAELLIAFARTQGVEPATASAFFAAVKGIESDFECRRVLMTVVGKPPLGREVARGVLDSITTISSDFERAEALLAFLRAHPIDAELRTTFLAAADGLQSTHEQNRVLAALVKSERR